MTANSPVYQFQFRRAIAELQALIAAGGGGGGGGSWGSIAGTLSAQTDLQTALNGKQVAGSYAAASHTHTIANVTGLQDALDGKQDSGSYVTTSALNELVDDRVNTLLVPGSNITLTYDDALNTLTISAASGGSNTYFPSGF